MRFSSKTAAREYVWKTLREKKLARFPFPVKGRIPNFKGAETAAEKLLTHPMFAGATTVKVNPDSPQRPVREGFLRRGVTVIMPSPKLADGFYRFDPASIPADAQGEASRLSSCARWAEKIPVRALPPVDAIICGSVAVTRAGKRCGKGHGYSDIEYAVLRELGHADVPVATTVHSVQVVDDFPADATDLPVSLIVTETETIAVPSPPAAPPGIAWDLLTAADLDAMPVLHALKPDAG